MDNDDFPARKTIRLAAFDYSTRGAYFITFCTKDKQKILSDISVGTTIGRPPAVVLSPYGRIVEDAILQIPLRYPMIHVDHYVIMPNHVHILLFLDNFDGRAMLVPTISRVIQQTKGYISKQIGHSIWQKRFYDHIIRNEDDYRNTRLYIDQNPARWTYDEYYS